MSEASKGGNPSWPLIETRSLGAKGMDVVKKYGDSAPEIKARALV